MDSLNPNYHTRNSFHVKRLASFDFVILQPQMPERAMVCLALT
jgi:hypothetical protein